MHATRRRSRPVTVVLWVLLLAAVVTLGVVAAVAIPILTHQSAGSSGQHIPDGFPSSVQATGADGRTRELRLASEGGSPYLGDHLQPGEVLRVDGSGFDASIGIYLAICVIPETPEQLPGPCLGGVPKGAEQGAAAGKAGLSSVWITDDWAWRGFATQGYADAQQGSFTATLTVPEPRAEGVDCVAQRCAITTRADHTAAKDRIQDVMIPIAYANAQP